MFDDKSNKRLPYFSDYILRASKNDPLQNREAWLGVLGLGVIGLSGYGFSVLLGKYGWPIAIGGTLAVLLPTLGILATKFESWLKRPRNETERRKIEVFAAVMQFHPLVEKRRLHKQLDPVAGQVLDAASYYWLQIRDTLSNSFWSHEHLGAHWKALRDQSLLAADMAMEDLVLLCANCIGKPQKNRSEDLREAFEDFVDLDFMDAVQNLRKAASDDWMKYAHKSPNMQAVFGPAREIAEKIKLLSTEVASMSQRAEAAPESPHRAMTTASSSAIDMLLNEMRATQVAEEELNQQRLNQGGG